MMSRKPLVSDENYDDDDDDENENDDDEDDQTFIQEFDGRVFRAELKAREREGSRNLDSSQRSYRHSGWACLPDSDYI